MEDSGSRLPARQDFPHLSDAHWSTLEKMVSLLGEADFAGFPNLPAEQQRGRVGRFDKYESSLIAHVSAAAQEAARATMRAEAQSAAQASATNTASLTAQLTTTKPVKMSVKTFDGKDSDRRVFWVREIEIALNAGQIYDTRAQVAFALSNLGGRARAWAMARETATGLSSSPASPKEQVPGTTLLWAAARSNLLVVTASVKGYPEPMTVLIDSGASFNVATQASVARNNALYASALEAAKSNTNVSVRLATGSIVSTCKVTTPLSVKFDDFNSVEPFIVLDMNDRYNIILGMPWLAKHKPGIDWRSRTIGASHNPFADRTLAGHVPSSSRDGFVHEHRVPRGERQFAGSSDILDLPTASPPRAREPQHPSPPPTQGVVAGSAHVEECAGVVARAYKSGRVGTPTTQGVVAGSARATEDAGACARAATSGRAGAPTSKVIRGDKVTSTPKAEASSRDGDSAAEDRVPQVVDVFTGEPKVGEAPIPLPTVAGLLELEELFYVEVLDSLKAGELAEVVLLRPEGGALELNSSSVMDSEILEDERTSRRQTRYGAAILKDPSDPYHPLLKELSDVVSDDQPAVLPPDRGVRHEIDLVPGTKYCTTQQWPLPKEQVDVIDAIFAAKHAAGMVRETTSPHLSPTFCVRKPNGKWRMVHALNKLNATTIPALTPIPRKDVRQNNMAGSTVFSPLDMVDSYYQLLMREDSLFGLLPWKDGIHADPEKVCAIAQWPVLVSQMDLRKWIVLPNYLHKYSANYAEIARPLTNLLKRDAVGSWTSGAQQAFEAITSSLQSAPLLALPDEDRPFSVIFDASEFAIGCALLQVDAEGRERLIREAYADDDDLAGLVEALSVPNRAVELTARQRSRLHRYSVVEGLLYYKVEGGDEPRIVVPNDEDLRHRVLYEAHDSPLSGYMGREKTYASVAQANAEGPRGLKGLRTSVKRNLLSFIETGEADRQCVRDAMAAAQDTQKEQSGRQWHKNTQGFKRGDQVLLNAKNLPTQSVSAVSSTKLRPRFVGPFTVIGVHGHAYTLDLPSSMATYPTFYVGLLKPYRPAGAAEPEGSTASPSTDGRRPPSPERTIPREPGQERESERQLEPLRGVRLASPSGPPGHTDSESRRGASPSLGPPLRRSSRLANIGLARGRPCHQDGLFAQAPPTRGLADSRSPGGHPGASPGGPPHLGREREAPPSQSAGHPAVVDRTPHQPEGSPGQGRSQSGDAAGPGRIPLPSRAPPPLLGNEDVLYYHVEKLLKRRGRSGQYQYLVKWRGYPSSRNSWELGARLEEDCADLVTAFESAHEPGRR
ncbi:unnamed protein product [Phytophthora fragariaefolia]|uniref:Unnamed protein product n=1 Tax=Phytophthora fragariaefolia TaxID=1490495 RepID=A0A9W7DER0_9STRA|nr:unnamed protein product [Phytophthora fragariaefolia]